MPTKAKAAMNRMTDSTQRVASTISAMGDQAEKTAEKRVEGKFDTSTRIGRVAQEGTLMTLLTLGILGIIGVLIYSEVSTSLPSPENEDLQNTSGNIDEGFANSMDLLPIVLIVLMAGLVIAVVQRFRG